MKKLKKNYANLLENLVIIHNFSIKFAHITSEKRIHLTVKRMTSVYANLRASIKVRATKVSVGNASELSFKSRVGCPKTSCRLGITNKKNGRSNHFTRKMEKSNDTSRSHRENFQVNPKRAKTLLEIR